MSRSEKRRVAMVTGASRGIGKATALALARRGYDVAITARTVAEGDPTAVAPITGEPLPGSLDTTRELVTADGHAALAVPLDLLDRDAIARAVDAVLDAWGHVDVLVNNAIFAGPGQDMRFLDHSPELIEQRLFANLTAQLLLLRALLPSMLAQGGGTVVNIGSGGANVRPPAPAGEGGWCLTYSASKAGFHRVAEMLAVEYGREGLVSYTVDPGAVVTERMRVDGKKFERIFEAGTKPEPVGEAIAWIADRGGDFENGAYIDGQDVARQLGLM